MSNPFDQFGAPGAPPPGPTDTMSPFAAPAPPPAAPQPPINAPPPMQGYGGYGAPPPAFGGAPPPSQPHASQPPMYGQSPYGVPPAGAAPMAPPSPAPSHMMAPPPPAPAPPAPASNPFGGFDAPSQEPAVGAPPPAGTMPATAPGAPADAMALTVSATPSNPYADFQAPPPAAAAPTGANPFESYGAPPPGAPPAPPAASPMPPQAPPAQPAYADPWGAPVPPQQHPGAPPAADMSSALVPAAPQPVADPFAVFNTAPAPAPTTAIVPSSTASYGGDSFTQPGPPAAAPAPASDDLWADMGFDPPVPASEIKAAEPAPAPKAAEPSGELPPGGEWYDAKIFTPTLGVMFFKPQELTDSLFLQTDKDIVDALEERPVVAFIVEGSSARSAGVELGHVLLKVNGIDVKNPKDASRLIKEGPRPLPLLFYVPNTNIVTAEGEHMVKYDTKETTAPNSAKDWKPKYVVIGGIIAQPWMMNMYRSKSEYDIAVIETQARRPVSVKVKQFSLQGARIQNDWQGPQMVKYKNKLHPWKYIVVLPVARNPIKISSPSLSQLKPVHEGIRRVLLAQQRDRGHSAHTAAPVRGPEFYQANGHGGDPYGRGGSGGGDPYGRDADPYARGGGGGGGDPYARGGGGDPYSRGGGGDPYARGGDGDPYARGGGGGYGQPQPAYGQPQPAYGQPQPAYGQPAQYGGRY